jgi:hypothetical protein
LFFEYINIRKVGTLIEYEVQFARITTTGKIPDRFLNCQSKASLDPAKAYMGTVYTLIEITSPWFVTSQVGQSIINTFSHAYYEGESTSDLDNFEDALKKVNENLAQITQNGETNWIGNLNAILAVQIDDKIHLAQTGQAEAYIFRDGKTNHLTYGLAQNKAETHPLKTFTNITSGALSTHDKVLIANPELFSVMSMDALCEIITMNSPCAAVLQIAKFLKKKKVKTINAIVMELLTADEASRIKVNNLSDNVQLDKPIETTWFYIEKIWRTFLKPTFQFIGAISNRYGERLWHLIRKGSEKAMVKIQERKAVVPRQDDKFENEFLGSDMNEGGLLKDEKIEYSPELNVHIYEREQKKKADKVGQMLKMVSEKTSHFINLAVSFFKNKRKRPYIYAICAVIVVIIIIVMITGKKPENKTKLTLLQSQTVLKDAQAAQKEAKTALLGGELEKAKLQFDNCSVLTRKIMEVDMLKAETKSLNNDCQSELDKLSSVTRFAKLTPIVTAAQDVKLIFVVGGQIYYVNSGEIYKSPLTGPKAEKVATLPRNNGDFQFGTVSGLNIYLYTSSQKVYTFNTDQQKLELVKIEGNWETANTAAYYAGSLYLLDGIVGQIYKHVASGSAFGIGQKYATSGLVDLKNNISLTIDGSIYTLNSAGEVQKIEKGKLVSDFALRDVPTPNDKIEKPIKIYTDSDTSSVYVLDAGLNKRVLEFDKDGHFIHQYALPVDFNNLTDFSVSIKAKKIWILNQSSLYEISI